MDNLTGLATGIGSLPFLEPHDAVNEVIAALPEIPFWPQLPRRSKMEGMILQYAQGMPCLSVDSGEIVFSPSKQEEELEGFYDAIIRHDLDVFAIGREYASGLYRFKEALKSNPSALKRILRIKGQITGPFTYAAALKDQDGVSLMHNKVFMQAITQGLAMKALWQQSFFGEFGKPMIMFIDEPFMSCFGSAYTPVGRADVLNVLSELTGLLKPSGMAIGIHCCGNTDWSLFTDCPGIDIINFDAFGFLDTFVLYAGSVRAFLERGGYLCWGIVPTQDYTDACSVDEMKRRLDDGINLLARKGVDKELIKQRLLLSPGCGLGTLTSGKAQAILRVLSETSALIRQ